MRRRDRERVVGFVARDTAAAVGAKVLEEGIGGGVGRTAKVQIREAAVRVGEFLVGRNDLGRATRQCQCHAPTK